MLISREEDVLMMNESGSITLLQLVQEVAYCDGSMSQEEENLIIILSIATVFRKIVMP